MLTLTAASCGQRLGDTGGSGRPSAPVVDPPIWAPTTAKPSNGSHLELCPRISRKGAPRTVSVVLPDRFAPQWKEGSSCEFSSDIDSQIYLSIGPRTTLATVKKKHVDPDVGDEGDDGVSDVRYDADVPVFGDRRGEALTYRANNDGLPIDIHEVQADGVYLRWDTPAGKWKRYAPQFAAMRDSVGVLGTREDLCSDPRSGLSVRYVLPPIVRAVEGYGNNCDLRLPPMTLTHVASLVVPAGDDLTDVRRRVEQQPGATDVHYDAQAPGFAGQPAERLDYLSGTGRRTLHIVLLQKDNVRLRWSARASVWPGDRKSFDQLRGSVRVDHLGD